MLNELQLPSHSILFHGQYQPKNYKEFESLFNKAPKKHRELESGEELQKFGQVVADYFYKEFRRLNDETITSHRARLCKLKKDHAQIYEQLCRSENAATSGSSLSISEGNDPDARVRQNCKEDILQRYSQVCDNQQINSDIRELHLDCILLKQSIQLDLNNFERIHRQFLGNLGHEFHNGCLQQQSNKLHNNLRAVERLIVDVVNIYASKYQTVQGDFTKALSNSHTAQNTEVTSFNDSQLKLRLRLEFGCIIALVIVIIYFKVAKLETFRTNDTPDWPTTIRLLRAPLVLSLFIFQAGVSLIIWRHFNINYEHIFQLDNGDHKLINLPYQHLIEIGSILCIVCCSALILWFVDLPTGCKLFDWAPLVIVLLILAYLVNPSATCHHRERFYLQKALGRILTAPLHSVQFVDYWIADQFVSIMPLFLDLEYIFCYYLTEEPNKCLARDATHLLLIRLFVAITPAWLRVCQCLRISSDEHWRPHQLFNAIKYGSMVYVITLSTVADVGNIQESLIGSRMKILSLVSSTIVSCVAAGWDMIYDFGVFESWYSVNKTNNNDNNQKLHDGRKRKPFLRKHLSYPTWFYYFAIIEDWILKFGWLLLITFTRLMLVQVELALTLTTILDLFSKFVWNVVKVENEWRLKKIELET